MELVAAGETAELVAVAASEFSQRFGGAPLIIARAPGRVNLMGEHTDYNAGLCLPIALPHASYAALRPRTDGELSFASAAPPGMAPPKPWRGRISEIGPGRQKGWPSYVAGVAWAMAQRGEPVPGFDLFVVSRVPLGAGLSSSAALECSVAVALDGLLHPDRRLGDTERKQLVADCIRAETEVAGAPTGGMDQSTSMLAAAGSALLLDFADDTQTQIAIPDGFELLVIDTQVSHALVEGGYGDRRAECERAARLLGVTTLREAQLGAVEHLSDDIARRRVRHIVTEDERVRGAVDALGRADWVELGRLFTASHASMRDDFEISCAELDVAVDAAVAAGAFGARMTGGGFGGSAIALVQPGDARRVAHAVEVAFAGAGFRVPRFLIATASSSADVVRRS